MVALAVTGGVVLKVVVAIVLVGLAHTNHNVRLAWTGQTGRLFDPAQEACVIFQRWVPTAGYNGHINKTLPGDVRLLRRAIADVDRSRLVRPRSRQRLNLKTYLTVLLHRVQEDENPKDLIALAYEEAIGNDCSLIGYGR